MSFSSVDLSDTDRSTPLPAFSSSSSPLPRSSSNIEAPAHQFDSIDAESPSSFSASTIWETIVSIKDWFVRHLESLFSCCCRTSTLEDRMSVLLPYFEQSPVNLKNPTLLTLPDHVDQAIEQKWKFLIPGHPRYSEIHQILSNCQQPTYFKTTEPNDTFYMIVLPIEIQNDRNSNWEPSYLLFEHDLDDDEDKEWSVYDSQHQNLDFVDIDCDLKDWIQALIKGDEASDKGIHYRLRQNTSS